MIGRALENQRILSSALAAVPPFTTVFPNSGIGGQMQMIARLVSARQALGLKRQVFFASSADSTPMVKASRATRPSCWAK